MTNRGSKGGKRDADNEWRALQQEGIRLFQQRRYADSLAELNASLALCATIMPTWVFKGYALRRLTRYEEALQAFNEAERLDAPIASSPSPSRVHIVIAQADILTTLGRSPEAVALLEETTQQFPLHALLWSMLASILARVDNDEQALTTYRHALTLVSADAGSHELRVTAGMASVSPLPVSSGMGMPSPPANRSLPLQNQPLETGATKAAP